jgi:hypothetical protein
MYLIVQCTLKEYQDNLRRNSELSFSKNETKIGFFRVSSSNGQSQGFDPLPSNMSYYYIFSETFCENDKSCFSSSKISLIFVITLYLQILPRPGKFTYTLQYTYTGLAPICIVLFIYTARLHIRCFRLSY